MRTVVVDYAHRTAECRRLAAQYTRGQHWAHFLEMAETWEMLQRHQQERLEQHKKQQEFKQQQEESRLKTIALADQFRDILLLSDTARTGR